METISDYIVYNWRRVLSWFKDDVFRRLFINAGKLLTANGIAALLSFVSAVLTARTLGPESYGILALVVAYVMTVRKLVAFNAWQAIIKFGSEALQADDRPGLRQLVKFGFSLDAVSAIVGVVLAMALSGPVISLLAWDQSVRLLLVLYSMSILFHLSGTPTGLLRLFNRFDLLGYSEVLCAVLGLGGVVWCLFTGQDLYGFVLVYLITGILGQLYIVFASLWVLRRHGLGAFITQPLAGVRERFPGIVDYVWTTNLTMTIRMLSREADSLFIAGLTTPAALGIFKVAKQFSSVLPRFSDPLSQAIYPELAHSWAKGDRQRFLSLMKRTTLFTGTAAFAGWFGFVILGPWILDLTVGSAFHGAYLITVFYMLAMVVFLCSVTLTPSMLAIGLTRKCFYSNLVATAVYFCLLFPFVRSFGIVGATLAYLGYFLVWSMLMVFYLFTYLRNQPVITADAEQLQETATEDH